MMREELQSGLTVLHLMVHRYRKVYVAFPLYLLFLIVMFHLPKSWAPDVLLGFLLVPFGLGLLWTVFGFVNADADIASSDTAYSPWILRLPLKTRSLAMWPMLAATAWGIGSWLILSLLCLKYRFTDVSIAWPALAVAALALIFQAILWPPVKVGSMRMVLAMTLPTAVALFGTIATANKWTAEVICEVYAGICLAAAGFGYAGLVNARTTPSRGKLKRESVEAVSDIAVIQHSKKPFRSPEAAQFWLEWRMQGRLLPLLTILVLALASVGLFFERDDIIQVSSVYTYVNSSGHTIGSSFNQNFFLKTYLPLLPWVPLVLATIIGLGARPASLRGADGAFHLYHATRPLSPSQMYWAKMKSIGAGTLLACGATVLVMLVWGILPINESMVSATMTKWGPLPHYGRSSFLATELTSMDAQGTLRLTLMLWAVCLVTFTLWTWRNQAVGACMDYVSSTKLAKAYPLAVVIVSASIITIWQSSQSLYQVPQGLWLLCGVLTLWIAAKAAVAAFGLLKLKKLRPSESSGASMAIAGWLAAGSVAAIALGVVEHSEGEYNFYMCLRHPVPELLAFVLVPVARPILARIALETGRHR